MIKNFYNLKEAALEIGYPGGRNKFSKFLKENEILYPNLCPNEDWVEEGLLTTEHIKFSKTGHHSGYHTMITSAGIEQIKNLIEQLKKENYEF